MKQNVYSNRLESYKENSMIDNKNIFTTENLDDRSFPGFPGWNIFMNEFRKAYNIKKD